MPLLKGRFMSPATPPVEAELGRPLYTIEHTKEQFISKKYPYDVGLRHRIQDGCAHVKCQGGTKLSFSAENAIFVCCPP